MSFGGFGSSTPAAGSGFSFGAATSTAVTPIKPTGFGTSGGGIFSTPAASASQPLFGTPAASTSQAAFGTPAAGSTSQNLFGTPAAGTAQPFGTPASAQNQTLFGRTSTAGFGAASTSTTQSLFGTPAGTQQQTTGFGAAGTQQQTIGFGAAGTQQQTTGFGTAGTQQQNTGFGTAATQQQNTGFGTGTSFNLGSTAPANQSLGGFGGFGTTATTSSAPLFGGFNTSNTQQQPPAFGSSFGGFGAKPATSSSAFNFGGLGTGGTNFSNFGSGLSQPQQQAQQQQQQQQQLQSNSNSLSEALYNAVFNCQLFNDERDNTIARWNLIQGLWGTGKAYYSVNAPPIELNQENPLCRFKAIGYSRIPDSDNNDGLVVFCFPKKEQELRNQKQQLISSLGQILGNKPNLTVAIDNIKSIGELKSQVIIFVTEKGVTGSVRKIPANELFSYLTQSVQKQQLTQLGVENVYPQVQLDPAQLKEYLETPPCSIDPRLWKQAQLDNPNPEHYVPVPMIGFQQVKHRLKCQEEETSRHRAYLDMAADTIQGLQRQHTATQARLKEHRRTLLELQHRVLQVLVRQEITRKVGFSLQPEEEALTNSFAAMHSQISAPTQFKGRISEMLSQLRMRRHTDTQSQERYFMDPIAQDDIKAYLNMEQQGMGELIETVNSDLEGLKIIKDGMSELISSPVATS